MPQDQSPRVETSGGTMLLADAPDPDANVVLADLAGVDIDDVSELIAELIRTHSRQRVGVRGGRYDVVAAAMAAGASVIVAEVDRFTTDELISLARQDVLIVITRIDSRTAARTASRLGAAGLDASQLVFELGPDRHVVAKVAELDGRLDGVRIGAVIDAAQDVDLDGATSAGSEIGALTGLMLAEVATIRGVSARRFSRVMAVLDAPWSHGCGSVAAAGSANIEMKESMSK